MNDTSLIPAYHEPMADQWLTTDEQRAWRAYVRVGTMLSARLNRMLQAECGLSLSEYEVLVALSEAPGGTLRPFQLRLALNWEQSRLSHMLSRMSRRGFVARRDCADDRRGAVVVMTAAGHAAIEAAAPGHVAAVRRLVFDQMDSAQCTAFGPTFEAILAALEDSEPRLPALRIRAVHLVALVVLACDVFVFVVVAFDVFVVLVGEIFELDAVNEIETLGRVGLTAGVGRRGAGERVPGLVGASGIEERIRVSVEEPRRPGTQPPPAGQLGHLQGDHGGVRESLIPADPGLDDAQLDLGGAVEGAAVGLADQGQRPVRPAQGTLAVGHHRKVVVASGHPPRGSQLSQGFGPPSGLVGSDPGRLPDHAHPGREALGDLSVCIPLLGVRGHSRGDQVTGHGVGQFVRQAVQLGTRLGVELRGSDGVREAGAASAWRVLAGAFAWRVLAGASAGPGLSGSVAGALSGSVAGAVAVGRPGPRAAGRVIRPGPRGPSAVSAGPGRAVSVRCGSTRPGTPG
jgi:DNA-binding MarR family transcriptional regulator